MNQFRPPEHEQPSRTIEVLAEHVSNEFRNKWLSLGLNTDAYDLGKVNEGEYYRTARVFTDRHGFSRGQALELVNFEIHQNLEQPHSAEFKLLANPLESGLLEHLALLENDISVDSLLPEPKNQAQKNFIAEHAAIASYDHANPGLLPRIVLTRTIGAYRGIKNAKDSTEQFLETLQADAYTSQQEVDHIRDHNLNRIQEWKLQLELIERLARSDIKTLSPAEYADLVESYLLGLIKKHEDRLNPFSKDERPQLPGATALKAFFESHFGFDYPKIPE